MVTVSKPRCGWAPTPRRFEVGSKVVGPPKSSSRKGENARGLSSYEKMLRTGKPSPTQWPCGLRWIWDTDFIVGSPLDGHSPPMQETPRMKGGYPAHVEGDMRALWREMPNPRMRWNRLCRSTRIAPWGATPKAARGVFSLLDNPPHAHRTIARAPACARRQPPPRAARAAPVEPGPVADQRPAPGGALSARCPGGRAAGHRRRAGRAGATRITTPGRRRLGAPAGEAG